MDNLSYNSVLAAINISDNDKIILVKENKLADANFVLTHLIKHVLANSKNKLCLVTLHNSLKHYISIGKRLGYDLQKKIDEGSVRLVEPIKSIAEDLGTDYMRFINQNTERIAKYFFKNIENEVNVLHNDNDEIEVYVIIDDLSYLFDMNVEMNYIYPFLSSCINLEQVSTIINCHITSNREEILANSLEYIADIVVEVSSLKSGKSMDVTGVMSIRKPNSEDDNLKNPCIYHYKAYDRGIKTFKPGETLKFL